MAKLFARLGAATSLLGIALVLLIAVAGVVTAFPDASQTFPAYIQCLNSTTPVGQLAPVVACGGGGGGSVTQGTVPWIIAGQGTAGTPAGGVVSVQFPAGGSAFTATVNQGTSPWVVTTPAPVPTVSPYAIPASLLACPSAAPAVSNSTYLCTINSSGQLNVLMPSPPPASVAATSLPTTGIMTSAKASAGTLVGATFTNSQAVAAFCGVYNTASAPTLGTTNPLVYVEVPAGATVPVYVPPTLGDSFSTGITAACETGYRNGTGSVQNTIFASVSFY